MLIACDVDGVVRGTMEGFVIVANHLYPSPHRTVSQITEWDIGASFGLTDEQVASVFRSLDWYNLKPLHGAIDVLTSLREFHQIVFVTARDRGIYTEDWLAKFLPNPSVANIAAGSKATYCRSVGASVLIEDRPSEVEACDAAAFPTILLDQPWSRNVDHPMRARDWHDIATHIGSLELTMRATGEAESVRV